LAFGLGLEDPVAAADGLTRQAGWTDAGEWIPDFDPSETPGELPVLEVEEEPESEEWEDAELEASEEDVATDIESEASGKEPEKAADRGDLKYSRRSTAFYRWAQRQTRSGREHGRPAYHGWASGRRLEPVRGMSLRTRQLWRCAMPEPDPSELED
jgi:hypothetical protein